MFRADARTRRRPLRARLLIGADSLAVVELVLAFEENFGISIPDTDADKLRTVGDAVTYVTAHGGTVRARPSDAA